MSRFAALLAALLAALVLSTGVAAAHAELISMTPDNGTQLAAPPEAVVLKYSEVVQFTGTQIVVTSPSGANVSAGPPDVLDNTVTQPLATLTEAGAYTIAARVVSADGHPVTATGTFTVTHAAHGTAVRRPAPAAPTSTMTDSDAAAASSAVVLVIAGALGVAIARRRRTVAD